MPPVMITSVIPKRKNVDHRSLAREAAEIYRSQEVRCRDDQGHKQQSKREERQQPLEFLH